MSLPPYVKLVGPEPRRVTDKVEFLDEEFGRFEASISDVRRGRNLHPLRLLKLGRKSQKLTAAMVASRLPPHVILDETTFVDASTKATFLDSLYGPWEVEPARALRGDSHPKRAKEQRKATTKERFGTNYAIQNRDVLIKAARKKKNAYVLTHFKTGDEVIAVGGYERAIVEYLNNRQRDYHWQVPVNMPDGTVYFVDFYLPDSDLYVECKGRWRDVGSKAKWLWFHAHYPNSELWDKSKLVQMGIIGK